MNVQRAKQSVQPNNFRTVVDVGAVVIGRNEGERLAACLRSVSKCVASIVYVDSGSSDDSLELAAAYGAHIVELDCAIPFTAARARNEGFRALRKVQPKAEFVQFIDGDCEVSSDWIETAATYLRANPDAAVACGRRRERYPNASVYNLLCDIEWDTPIGEAHACGGDALMRVSAFEQVNGFRDDLIAGEEPELCVRLRQQGWTIWRLDHEMTMHDAAMTHFLQWWKRAVRAGYAFAEGSYLHGQSPQRHWVAESRRIWFWGLALPIAAFVLAMLHPLFLLLLVAYPLQIIRLALKGKRTSRENWIHAVFLVLGKVPEVLGQSRFFVNKLARRKGRLIEYK